MIFSEDVRKLNLGHIIVGRLFNMCQNRYLRERLSFFFTHKIVSMGKYVIIDQ